MTSEFGTYLAALTNRSTRLPDEGIPNALADPSINERLRRALASAGDAAGVIEFWLDAGPGRWFAKEPAFDCLFRERFQALHERAARGELMEWTGSAAGTLALLLLLDQYPRNSFRGTTRMYATDPLALGIAAAGIDAGHDMAIQADLRLFVYLPFSHSESLADQDRAVALSQSLGQPAVAHAEGHRDIIRRFGRFPHRNPILGRVMSVEEQRFLDEGGFSG